MSCSVAFPPRLSRLASPVPAEPPVCIEPMCFDVLLSVCSSCFLHIPACVPHALLSLYLFYFLYVLYYLIFTCRSFLRFSCLPVCMWILFFTSDITLLTFIFWCFQIRAVRRDQQLYRSLCLSVCLTVGPQSIPHPVASLPIPRFWVPPLPSGQSYKLSGWHLPLWSLDKLLVHIKVGVLNANWAEKMCRIGSGQ